MKRIVIGLLLGLASAGPISFAADSAQSQLQEQVKTTLLLWQEQEPGVTPYPTRMLVTADHLRSDEGRAEDDYLLYDRKSGKLYSVMHEERTVLVIDAEPLNDPDGGPVLDIELRVDEAAPRIDGKPVQYFRARHAGELCSQATLVAGLLPDVAAALRAMRAVLSGRQLRDLHKTPEEYRTPCFLAAYIYAVDRPLSVGLPIQESIAGGIKRVLLDYKEGKDYPADLFAVPADYRVERMP